ncbi:MAG: IclR family transcriptional regulator [Rhodobacteraceae bacterium]|nr:IclR family transcriptional regulator [Paracoccaceae bacterium]
MGTVAKALSLLSQFSLSRPEIGLSDMARLSGMNKATVFRLLSELETGGLIEQIGPTRAYRLGSGLLRLATLRDAAVPLRSIAGSVLDELCATTHETVHMSLLQGQHLNALAHRYSSTHATRVTMEDAAELSFHATSSGLAVLAFSDPGFVDTVLSSPLRTFTKDTRTDSAQIRATLDSIRQTGIAESIGGFEVDVHSHAAPVFGPNRHPIGALAVAAPVSRMTGRAPASIQRQVATQAQELTKQIGGFCPPDFPISQD